MSPIVAIVCLLELFLVSEHDFLSKFAYFVAGLKQNLPLDHAETVFVAVNRHFPFVHRRMVRKLNQRTDRQSFK